MDFIEPCFGIGHNLSLICQMTSEDIKHQLIIIIKEIGEGRQREADMKGLVDEANKKGLVDEANKKGFVDEANKKGLVDEANMKGLVD